MLLVDTWMVIRLIPNVTFPIFLHLSYTCTSNIQPTSGLHKFDVNNVEFWNRRNDMYSLERTTKGKGVSPISLQI